MYFKDKDQLETRREVAEQYDFYGLEDDYDNEADLKIISPKIGEILIAFGELEHTIERAIYFALSDRSDQMGMVIVKFLDFSQKIDMFNELTRIHLNNVYEGDRTDALASLKSITGILQGQRNIRNIIAHAKWASYTSDGFVRTSIKANKSDGTPEVLSYHLALPVLEAIVDSIDKTDEDLYLLLEEWELY